MGTLHEQLEKQRRYQWYFLPSVPIVTGGMHLMLDHQKFVHRYLRLIRLIPNLNDPLFWDRIVWKELK